MEVTEQMTTMLARKGVRHSWDVREAQAAKQRNSVNPDHGFRGAVTGGAQMNGFVRALQELAGMVGVPPSAVYTKSRFLELPGYFRPTKEWDFLIVFEGLLGHYSEQSQDIDFYRFATAFVSHLRGCKP